MLVFVSSVNHSEYERHQTSFLSFKACQYENVITLRGIFNLRVTEKNLYSEGGHRRGSKKGRACGVFFYNKPDAYRINLQIISLILISKM
jgi:hypothetical protein